MELMALISSLREMAACRSVVNCLQDMPAASTMVIAFVDHGSLKTVYRR